VGLDRLALGGMSVRIAAVFPGQGSQAVGMGGALVEHSPIAADLFARAERVLGYDLLALVREGPEEKLRETHFSQPAIYVTNYALAAAVGDALEPVASAGHSFGEFCSLTLAGSLTFESALELVRERGLAMQEAAERAPGAMSAVLGLEPEAVRAATEAAHAEGAGRVRPANFNAPGQIVISGDRDAVARAGELALAAGAKRVVALNVSGAWHSELMAPAQSRFATFIEAATFELPRFPVISNVDAQPYRDVATIKKNLIRSVTDEVRWHATAERLLSETHPDLVVEFGGSAVLAPLFKRVAGAPPAQHVGDERGVERLRERLATPAAS
jgi:[acyl-carrier-protein] S-malonyltransferase